MDVEYHGKRRRKKDHDENLHDFLLRMQQVELKQNPGKLSFKTPKVFSTGFQLSPEGVSPAPTMVEAILSMVNAEFPCKVLSKLERYGQGFKRINPQRYPLSVE